MSYTFNGTGTLTQAIVNAEIGSSTIITITGYDSIGDNAFLNSNITSVTIGNTVTTIGDLAFQNCTSLSNVTFSPTSILNSIGYAAFDTCSTLASINIPDSVTTIGDVAFNLCSSLANVTLPTSLITIGNSAFQDTILSSIEIPGLVITIGNFAFSGTSLVTVTFSLPSTLSTIGDSAFQACINLSSISIPDSVTTIGDSAFKACSNLSSISIPDSVTTIGASAFNNCINLLSISIPDSVTTIGDTAFFLCSSLTTVTFSPTSTLTSIGNDTFRESGLTSINIPASVTTIGTEAFNLCPNLTTVTFSPTSTLTSINNGTFRQSGLTSIDIPSSVTTIGSEAFKFCINLASISIPDSVTTIYSTAFQTCINLSSISIPDSVTTIGAQAFYMCSNLTSVIFDDQINITTLGSDIFTGNSPTNNVLFYKTANYAALSDPNGQQIAAYFNTVEYNPNPACFNENTKILCLNNGEEEYIPVQHLKVNDLVKTYLHGYRKIRLIKHGTLYNNPSKFTTCMYVLKKTEENGLLEDLIVTGGHSILVDELTDEEEQKQKKIHFKIKIDDKHLLLSAFSSLFEPVTEKGKKFTWYHFCLEPDNYDERFGVYANGVLLETPSENYLKQIDIPIKD